MGTVNEPMYMATRFFLWCKYINANPLEFDIERWIN